MQLPTMFLVMALMQAGPPPAHLDHLPIADMPAWYYDPAQRIPPEYISPLNGSRQPNRGPLTRPEKWRILLGL